MILGVSGQDGAHLADYLLKNGYQVFGGYRRSGINKLWRLNFLKILNKINLVEFDLREPQHLIDLFKKIQPHEIYNLAGDSFVADSFDHPFRTMDTNVNGALNILEAARLVTPKSKIFFASSSEVFGNSKNNLGHNEQSLKFPCNPYGISKLTADNFVRLYREKYDIYSCSGILFNHEGPLRSRHFVTRKITYNFARLKLENNSSHFELGNFNSSRDWGSAEDYVQAMNSMLTSKVPNDFVISTGKLTSVRQLLIIAANCVGFDPFFEGSDQNEICFDKTSGRVLAKVSFKYFRPFDTEPMYGDSSLIKNKLGWKPSQRISDIIESMVSSDLYRRKQGMIDV